MVHIRRYQRNFSEGTRRLFDKNYECWVCGKNSWDALHHILNGNFEEADSVLNAAPICNFKCHIGKSFSEEQKAKMLNKTLDYLALIGYRLTDKDREFIEKNKKHYEEKGEERRPL